MIKDNIIHILRLARHDMLKGNDRFRMATEIDKSFIKRDYRVR